MRGKGITFLIILIGLVLGSFIGEITSSVSFLEWLNYGKVVGIPNFSVDLASIQFNFGFTFNCTIACILGLVISLLVYYKIIK